jgi:two-component system response regulator DesR
MKLMIVDDHAGVRNLIRQLVAQAIDVVCECASGEEAVQAARRFQPDCVTVDLRMPGLGGFDTVRAIRAAHPATRILVVTSYDHVDLRRAAEGAGATGYVVKENLGELRGLVQGWAAEKEPSESDRGGI